MSFGSDIGRGLENAIVSMFIFLLVFGAVIGGSIVGLIWLTYHFWPQIHAFLLYLIG